MLALVGPGLQLPMVLNWHAYTYCSIFMLHLAASCSLLSGLSVEETYIITGVQGECRFYNNNRLHHQMLTYDSFESNVKKMLKLRCHDQVTVHGN